MNRNLPTDRTAELRHALVATVESSPYLPKRTLSRPSVVLAAAAALVLFAGGGALTGGTIAATAIGAPTGTVEELGLSEEATYYLGPESEIYGTPIESSDTGTAVIEVGPRPLGATALSVIFTCRDEGVYRLAIDGESPSMRDCAAETAVDGVFPALYNHYPVVWETENHTVSVTTEDGNGYDVWIAWSQPVRTLTPSSGTVDEALADGEISADEYRDAFDRYAACLAAEGYDIGSSDGWNGTGTIDGAIPEAAVVSGVDDRCYQSEYQEIDSEWQTQNNPEVQRDEAHLRACLIDLGIEPAETFTRMIQQLHDAGIAPTVCAPDQ